MKKYDSPVAMPTERVEEVKWKWHDAARGTDPKAELENEDIDEQDQTLPK